VVGAVGRLGGQAGSVAGGDANLDGGVNAADAALLANDLGYVATKPPVVVGAQGLTHVDLSFTLDLALYATDPQGLPLYFRVVSAQNGQAALAPDGHTVTFVPSAGYHGPASFQFVA